MVDWEPISVEALLARIGQGYLRMTQTQQRLWDAIRIDPQKWQHHPYGDPAGGFWTHIRGTCRRVRGFDPNGFVEIFLKIREGPLAGWNGVVIEPHFVFASKWYL